MSKKLIHSSPLGALEIPGVPGAIEPGKPFTVDDATAARLLTQSDLYAPAPTAAKKAAPTAAKKAAAAADTKGATS